MADQPTQLRSMLAGWEQSTYGGNSGSSCWSSCMRLPQLALGVKMMPCWEDRPLKATRHVSECSSRSRISSEAHSTIGFDTIGCRDHQAQRHRMNLS